MCMKKHNRKNTNKNNTPNSDRGTDNNIELIAIELDKLARQRLPDGVLQGKIKGYEAEIRQDAILLALEWYLRHSTDEYYREKHPWIPARALAHALKIQKRDYLKAIEREQKESIGMPIIDPPASLHPSLLSSADWSASTIESVLIKSIKIAQRSGKISLVNALIARLVLIHNASVSVIALRLEMGRSNVYQHLHRTRKIIIEIIEQIEPPMIDPM